MAMLLITHDLGVIAGNTQRVMVMYAGRLVESSSTEDVFTNASHPYTVALHQSLPRIDERQDRLPTIEGQPPDLRRAIRRVPLRAALPEEDRPLRGRGPAVDASGDRPPGGLTGVDPRAH